MSREVSSYCLWRSACPTRQLEPHLLSEESQLDPLKRFIIIRSYTALDYIASVCYPNKGRCSVQLETTWPLI